MAFSWFGTDPSVQQVQNQSPEQQQLLKQILGMLSPEQFQIGNNSLYQTGSSYLQNLLSGSPESYQQFEQPLMRQFNEEILPSISNRFGRGTGVKGSSGFQQSLAHASTDLGERLGALRGKLQLTAAPFGLQYAQQPTQNAMGLAGIGLGTSPFSNMGIPGSQGFIPGAFGGLLSGIGSGLGGWLGGLF